MRCGSSSSAACVRACVRARDRAEASARLLAARWTRARPAGRLTVVAPPGAACSSIAALVLQLRAKAATVIQRCWKWYAARRRDVAKALYVLRSGPLRPREQDAVLALATSTLTVGACGEIAETLAWSPTSSISGASPGGSAQRGTWVSHSREFQQLLPPNTPEARRLCAGATPTVSVQSAIAHDCEWDVLLLSAPGDLGDSRELLARFAPKVKVHEALLTDGLPSSTMPHKTKVSALRCPLPAAGAPRCTRCKGVATRVRSARCHAMPACPALSAT
jgi:hypothetical protein